MKQIIKSIAGAALAVLILSASCKKTPVQDNTGSPNDNTLKGTIYDAKGNKYAIDNSNVIVHVQSPGGAGQSNLVYHINMDDNSHYEKKVTTGMYAYDTRAIMSLNGKVVQIRLDPVDGAAANKQFNSAQGVTRDFRLKLTGLVPGGSPSDVNSYYGAKVSVCDGADNYTPTGSLNSLAAKYPGSTVIFTLTPKGPCLDGSTAPLKDINVSVADLLNGGKYLVNFPLAKYYLSALLRKPTGQQYPLKLTFASGATGAHYNFLDLTFSPATNDPDYWPGSPSVAVWEN